MIYEVPTRYGTVCFDQLRGQSQVHVCPAHNGELLGPWKLPIENLREECGRRKLQEPHRLAIIVCAKDLGEPGPLHRVALKTFLGERLCGFFAGPGLLLAGDLLAVCGESAELTLLTNRHHVLATDGQAEAGLLSLPCHWLQDADRQN
jgi:hypothetical protein